MLPDQLIEEEAQRTSELLLLRPGTDLFLFEFLITKVILAFKMS